MKYIERLTEKQKEMMPVWRDKWIAKGLQTGETDWGTFEKYIPICYQKAKIRYPNNIIKVSSPLVGGLAAMVANEILKKNNYAPSVGDVVGVAVRGVVGGVVDDAVNRVVRDAVGDAVDDDVGGVVGHAVDDDVGAVDDAVGGVVRGAVDDVVDGAVRGAVDFDVRGAVSGAVDGVVGHGVGDVVGDAVRDVVGDAVHSVVRGVVNRAVSGVVGDVVGDVVNRAVGGVVRGTVDGVVRDAVNDVVGDAVNRVVGDAVDNTVRGVVGGVGGAVNDVVGGVVRGTVDVVVDAVDDAVNRAVGGVVRGAVDFDVHSVVRDVVDDAVRDVVDDAVDGVVNRAVSGVVGGVVGDAVRDVVGHAVRGAVDFDVRDAVDDVVDGVVRDVVDDAVRDVVGDAVRDAVDLLRSNGIKNASWHYWLGGQFWVGGWWGSPSFVSFFREVCGLELDQDIEERAEAYQKICESVNYIWLNSHFTMVCARPTEIHRDDQGRLHNENGLAIKYLDGWGLYAINGVTVSEQIVLRPETLTINQIQKESNQEKRRIMIERFGVDKYLQAINATIVDVDMRGVIGAGARALMKDDKADCWFIGTDGSTDRVYNMYVGQGYTTCKEAHEALCGFSESLIKAEG